MPMTNTDKYILAGVIFLIVVATIILVYLNLRRRHKHDGNKHDGHTEVPCPTECAKKLKQKVENEKEKVENEEDEEDCKCGV